MLRGSLIPAFTDCCVEGRTLEEIPPIHIELARQLQPNQHSPGLAWQCEYC
jgi:hypothetical protein